jgi:hypothetical protein
VLPSRCVSLTVEMVRPGAGPHAQAAMPAELPRVHRWELREMPLESERSDHLEMLIWYRLGGALTGFGV